METAAPRIITPQAKSVALTPAEIRQRLQRLDRLSEWLDSSIELPVVGFNIGWDTLIGLIPGIGDAATTAISAWIIKEARALGVGRWTLTRMIANVAMDGLVGTVPLAGDVFDAMFKANLKNLRLLKNSLRRRGLLPEEDSEKPQVIVQPSQSKPS
jgi:hypothetical protein